jgi:ABC-type nitrate/sulfonate/bicarbonate transport system substrate-binding protein
MRAIRIIGAAAMSLAFMFCFTAAAPAQNKQLPIVKVGTTGSLDSVALVIAVEQGFYEQQGIDGKLAPAYPTGVETLNALQAGNIDFAIAGNPAIGGLMSGMDIVYLGPHAGIAGKVKVDENMVVVAGKNSGIDPKNLSTLKGKKFGTTVGGAPDGYLSGLLKAHGITREDVTITNVAPADMGVALQTGGVDAIVVWDPWVGIVHHSVAGSYEASRGGGYVASVGFILARREYVEKNPKLVKAFLMAYDTAIQWARKNPEPTAQAETRWMSGITLQIAQEAMPTVLKTQDPRVSGCLLLGLDQVYDFAVNVQKRKPVAGFDLASKLRPDFQLDIQKNHPELFADLPKIPAGAVLPSSSPTAWKSWNRDAAKKACAS